MERLDKFLTSTGAGTRSEVRNFIKQGRVTVDGISAGDPGMKIDPAIQQILLDGTWAESRDKVVLMMNKPAGYVTSTEDPRDPTVMELLPEKYRRMGLNPVGRLDKATEGLLLFTNDGALLHRLISPRKQISKVYYARHEGEASQEDIEAFKEGLVLRDGTRCLPAVLKKLGPGECLITIYEGKYHQVRRMMASRQMHVLYLERRQEGMLPLGQLPRGEIRELTENECRKLEETAL